MSTPPSPPLESSPNSPESRRSNDRRALWLRIVVWAAVLVGVLVVLIGIAGSVLLHTARGRAYVLKIAETKATAALGVPVHVRDFRVHLTRLSLDIYGLEIAGAAPYSNPPLLVVPHISAGLGIFSIWKGKWYLRRLRVDRPVVHVFFAKDGTSNLPHPKSSEGGNHIDIFRLGIRHVKLDGGEVDYNDRKIPLEADLHDLNLQSIFRPRQTAYSGSLSYRNGRFRAGDLHPFQSDLDLKFEANPNVFRLTQFKLSSGPSSFDLTGTLRDYKRPSVEAQYEASLDLGNLGATLHTPSMPKGVVRARGSAEFQDQPGVPILDLVVLHGAIESRRLDIPAGNLRASMENLTAQFSVEDGNAVVRDVRANVLGGEINASLTAQNLSGVTRGRVSASIHQVSLADLKQAAPPNSATSHLTLAGVLNATAEGGWSRGLRSLVAQADATLRGHASRSEAASGVVPVNGDFHVSYRASQEKLTVSNSSLHLPRTTVAMNGAIGSMGKRTSLAVQVHSSDLGEIEPVVELFWRPKNGQIPQSLGLAGTLNFNAEVHGSITEPDLTGNLTATHLRVRGSTWDQFRAAVELSPSLLSIQNARLESVGHGNIRADARAQLQKWRFSEESPLQVSLHASDIDLSQLEKMAPSGLGLSSVPLKGMLDADLVAQGTWTNPVGHGEITLSGLKVRDQPIDSAKLVLTAADRQVQGVLTAEVAEGTVRSNLTIVPEQKTYTAQLSVAGIQIGKLALLKGRDIAATGVVAVRGSGQGTFSNPQFTANLAIPKLTIEQQAIENIGLKVNIADHVATAHLASSSAETPIQANAKVGLTGNYMTEANVDTQKFPLGPLIALYAPEEVAGVGGEAEIHATLRGPLKDKRQIEAHVTIPTLTVGYQKAIRLAATAPLQIDYVHGVVNLQRTTIQGPNTNLEIEGRIPVLTHAPISLLLKGTMDLKVAQLLAPDIQSSGQLQFDINSYGARADPNVAGQIRVVNASFGSDDLPVGLRRGNGVLVLTKDRLNVQSFEGTVGGGTVTMQGGITYRPKIHFDLGASAKGVRMLYPDGVREQIDADIHLAGTEDNALLGGQVSLDDVSFTPEFDLMGMIGELSGGVAPAPARGFSQNLNLNLAVNSTNNMNMVSRMLSIEGTANLRIRGTAAQPVILGRININGGDVIFNGQRFTVAGGTVEFVNPTQTQPIVNLAINTTIQQYNISMRFNGPVDRMHTGYSSDPSLPAADIINLLAFGQTKEASTANPTPGNQAAMSAVASQVSSQITSRVAKIAGISALSINPVLAGGSTQGPAGAIVTIQQRVTGNLFVTFSTNVATTQNQVIMGQYKLSPRTSVSVTRDQNGGFAFDTSFKKSW